MTIEEIKPFLYRVIYNDKTILFVIANMELLSHLRLKILEEY